MKSSKNYTMNIGTSSVLLIFFVLCLVSFAALSLSSALADKKLTNRSEEKTTSYYQACSIAADRLSEIDNELKEAYDKGMSETEYYDKFGHTINFSITISDSQSLYIELDVNYPANTGDTYYTVATWQDVAQQIEDDTDERLTLIK